MTVVSLLGILKMVFVKRSRYQPAGTLVKKWPSGVSTSTPVALTISTSLITSSGSLYRS